MNITNFLVTIILLGVFLMGTLTFTGEVFFNAGYSDTVNPKFENMTGFSNSTINSISGELYNSSKQLTPISSEASFLKNVFTAGKIIIDSISSFKNILSELFMILQLDNYIFYSISAIVMVSLILAVFWMIRGGTGVV